jgi:hypothetical protein
MIIENNIYCIYKINSIMDHEVKQWVFLYELFFQVGKKDSINYPLY